MMEREGDAGPYHWNELDLCSSYLRSCSIYQPNRDREKSGVNGWVSGIEARFARL